MKSFVLSVCLLVFSLAHAEVLEGRVVAIADGDTVTVLDAQQTQFKIRVAGIDAPEKAQAAGLAQVSQGLAWWYRAYANEQAPADRGRYEAAENEARARRVGLWRDPDPIPPWDWRKMKRSREGNTNGT